jgi:hypothetical protein
MRRCVSGLEITNVRRPSHVKALDNRGKILCQRDTMNCKKKTRYRNGIPNNSFLGSNKAEGRGAVLKRIILLCISLLLPFLKTPPNFKEHGIKRVL